MVDDHEQLMGNGDLRFHLAAGPGAQMTVFGSQVAVLPHHCCTRTLHKGRANIRVSLACGGAMDLPATFPAAWRHSSPGRQVVVAGPLGHVDAQLRNEHGGREAADARNGHQQIALFLLGAQLCIDEVLDPLDVLFHGLQTREMKGQQLAGNLSQSSGKGGPQKFPLVPDIAVEQLGEFPLDVAPLGQGFQDAIPDTPNRFESSPSLPRGMPWCARRRVISLRIPVRALTSCRRQRVSSRASRNSALGT